MEICSRGSSGSKTICVFKSDSIKSYKSALKSAHIMNGSSTLAFESPLVNVVLQGMSNLSRALNVPNKQRLVLSMEVLKILGHALASSNFSPYDRQVIWTAMLIGYFCSIRMGEILTDNNTSSAYDPVRLITWKKFREVSSDNVSMFIAIPKVSDDSRGVVVDMFTFKDPSLCPVQNLKTLLNMSMAKGLNSESSPVFMMESGKLLTKEFMNQLLKSLLLPYFPASPGAWSCHSFRAGAASHMAAHPELFTAEEVRLQGRWKSETYLRYCRLTGIAQRSLFSKFQNSL